LKPSLWLSTTAAAVLIVPLAAVASASGAAANDGHGLTVTSRLHPTSTITADKAITSSLARTDRALLGRTSPARIPVMVKLDYDPLATYDGSIRGLAATSPSVTGQALGSSASQKPYAAFIAAQNRTFARQLSTAIPRARIGQVLTTVYGGMAVRVPANRISTLLRIPGVVAVQNDALRQPLTDSSVKFIGATSLNGRLGGAQNAGKGVIFGSIDTGVWPEHPSFADQGNLGAPPPKADSTPRACNFGDDPLTPANDPFQCNNKLIGGQPFLSTYNAFNNDQMYPTSARDSEGHGTHTASTAAGDVVSSAKIFGVERGPIRGVAPGAWVEVYKVCGPAGCYSSDSAAAIQQALLDGVNVLNFSISGGTNPFTDPVEMSFLDAYAAGVFVAASAGNSGPGAGTTAHVSPWVTTVAASTQTREFQSTLTLQSGADSLVLKGSSITDGVSAQTPVVLASAAPYSSELCLTPAAPGTFTGEIVICKRGGNARVAKGYNVLQGGAAGMILYNPGLADTETDNHWLPTVHLADGTAMIAWLAAHGNDATASFTPGAKANGKGDVMASFSSRGPGGLGIKPDITAPGIQILAGDSPTPDSTDLGPPGELYQAIAGTSMSSPHIAGSAILEKALHPSYSPGQIKSALMTTAKTGVVKENGVTKADPFDDGSGRVDLTKSDDPGLTFDESAADMASLGNDPVHAIDLNLPSIDAPVMPGSVTTVRTATNVTNGTQHYTVKTTSPTQSKITVSPTSFTLAAGDSVDLTITITSSAPTGQYFGQVRLVPASGSGMPTLHLPVAFVPHQAGVNLASDCTPSSVSRDASSTCTVTATNNTSVDTTVDLTSTVNDKLTVWGESGATETGPRSVEKLGAALNARHAGVPSIAAGAGAGYGLVPLASFGVTPTPIGDEQILNYTTPAFTYNGVTYNHLAVDSNGYVVVGGGTGADNAYLPALPSSARPNNVLAPFWTDLDGTGANGIYIATLTDGVHHWIVVEWQENVYGTSSVRHFQAWIGDDATQDISFAYDSSDLPGDPGQPFAVGAENENGVGQALPGLPAAVQYEVTSTAPTPPGTVSYTFQALGVRTGAGQVTSTMTTPIVTGTTIVTSGVTVTQ